MTRRSLTGTLVIAALLSSCADKPASTTPATALAPKPTTPTSAIEPASAWPQAMRDSRHAGTSSATGPQSGTVRWKRDLGGDATPGPVIGTDGSVIVATDLGVLSALDPSDGSTKWSFDGGSAYGNDLSTSPLVLHDGTIVWPGPGGALYGLTSSGHLAWKLELGGFVLSPAIATSGRIYAATMSGDLDAIDIAGGQPSIVWTVPIGAGSYASPAVAPDGTIIAGSSNELLAVTDHGATANIRWRHPITDTIEVSPAVSADGVVVIGDNGRSEYGIDVATGELRWTAARGDETYSSATIGPDGLARYGDHTATLYVVDTRTGAIVRSTTTRADTPGRSHGIWTAPAVDARGDTYYGTRSGHVFGVGPDGNVLFDSNVGGTVASYPAIGGDGSLYIGSSNGSFTAFGPG